MQNYLFGYGSLISKNSRSRTGTTGMSYVVRVNGIKRAWNLNVNAVPTTAVGIVKAVGSACNGIIVEINESELPKFDEREGKEYKRIKLDLNSIEFLGNEKFDKGIVWAYAVKKPGVASEKYPIIQSYVDVIISGCLEVNEDFAKEFVRTTYGWDYWINDRKEPRYIRHLNYPNEKKIDKLLQECISKEFNKRKN